ncbi:MAG: DegT/DnrJ/EryC1/StrS family aminotransferase [Bacteroidales bacterium]|jgi:dTDP-4-amino-4,6-dideoxygalactose transaminase|nr:DegT/DnrJ/EryC1/StrS family aminotransferase [Bacteroidales bacterium]
MNKNKNSETNKNIYVTMPTLAPIDELNAILQGVWERGILTHNGPVVQEFEREVARFLGLKNLVAVSNGTIAIQMGIKALELTGEIITSPFTFVATLSAIIWEHCTPVFVDINPETLTIDPQKIEERITVRTSAILPVHVFGNPCQMEDIDAIAKRHDLKVLSDAAHAVGVTYNGKSLLEYGDIAATSFHATKMLNTAEGGGCVASDNALHEKLKRIRFFGFDNAKDVVEDGFNGKMTEVHAALGLANLNYLQTALDDRKKKYFLYKEILSECEQLKFQQINQDCNYSYFPLIFLNEKILLTVEKALNSKHIFPRRYFYPSVNTFTKVVPYVPMFHSEDIAKRILCLPLYLDLSESNVQLIAETVLNTIQNTFNHAIR